MYETLTMAEDVPETLVGLDEAGCGPGFGSLWASAVFLTHAIAGLNDSKKLTEKRRLFLRAKMDEHEIPHGLGEVTSAEIDTIGLGEARRLVFVRALDDLVQRFPAVVPTKLIVDGTIFGSWKNVPHVCIPKADETIPCVAAASIYAKTTRDAQINAWCDEDPSLDSCYGIRSNKGYLSTLHIARIRTHGFTPRHRRSYKIKGLEEQT